MNKRPGHAEKRSEAEWERLMAAYEAGDLPQRAFCKARGVAYSSFGYWRRRLRSATAPLVSGSASSVAPLLEVSPLALGDAADWRVELELGGGIVLRLR
jgi:hypothetical protein